MLIPTMTRTTASHLHQHSRRALHDVFPLPPRTSIAPLRPRDPATTSIHTHRDISHTANDFIGALHGPAVYDASQMGPGATEVQLHVVITEVSPSILSQGEWTSPIMASNSASSASLTRSAISSLTCESRGGVLLGCGGRLRARQLGCGLLEYHCTNVSVS